ncbi:hypothetical protein EV361DRAFT_801857, partial [Lentinula raphanica]
MKSSIHEHDVDGDDHIVPSELEQLLNNNYNIRPTFSLQSQHPQCDSHMLELVKPGDRQIPVPIGPGLPRRDRPKIYERYCRLMLILFKPWREISCLRTPSQKWSEAFKEFNDTCPKEVKQFMNNMQLLHECKDSRDDHFAERRR